MTEFDLIARLAKNLPGNPHLVRGPGDDCAVIDLGIPDRTVLFKTDAVVEGVHFTAEAAPERVGRKALGRPLSDIAAMAGKPVACLVTLGLPKGYDEAWPTQFYEGLNELARQFEVAVAGGETTRSNEGIFASVTVLGTIPRDRLITRSGARAGDAIFVTGELGGSISGKHLDFTPRIEEAEWLASHFALGAMMDLSDGLAGDLRHILQASKVGAELLAGAVPISRAAKLKAKAESSAKPPLLAALTDGEDFELMFTVAAKDAVKLLDGWKERFPGIKLSCVGRITDQPGLRIRDKEGVRELSARGYTHFKES